MKFFPGMVVPAADGRWAFTFIDDTGMTFTSVETFASCGLAKAAMRKYVQRLNAKD